MKDISVDAVASPLTSKRDLLLQLRERLRAAVGPDRGIDADLHAALTGRITHQLLPTGYTMAAGADHRLARAPYITRDRGPSPSYTGNVDAALGLVDGDDRFWRVGHDGAGPDPAAFKAEFLAVPARKVEAVADTAPLALCLARVEYELAHP